MTMDPNRWLSTLPINSKLNLENDDIISDRWVKTLPNNNNKTLPNNNNNNKKAKNPIINYSLTAVFFVIGLIVISVIKNETRNLEKEISALQAAINTVKLDLHQSELDYEVITSPKNILNLARENLDINLISYKKTQIVEFNNENKNFSKQTIKEDKKNIKKISKEIKADIERHVAKKIEIKKTELRKLQELYSNPENLSKTVKLQVAKKIEKTKTELKQLASSPKKEIIKTGKFQKWAAVQVVKAFFGIPIIPGK